MATQIRVTYKNGVLIPDEPVPLLDGESTHIAFVSRRDMVRQALSDLLVPLDDNYLPLSATQMQEAQDRLDKVTKGQRSFSEDIIKEREEGW